MPDFMKALADVNVLAVFVGALAAFAVGSVWYSSALFSKPWQRELGLKESPMSDPKAKAGLPMMLGADLALTLILGLGLAILMNLLGVESLGGGVAMGAFVAIFFSAVTTGIHYVFERRSLKLFLINAGYVLVMGIVLGGIIGVWPQ